MSKEQKKFQKRKNREKNIKAKLLVKREIKAKKLKEIDQEKAALDAVNKLVKQRVELEQWAKEVEGKIPADTHSQIQHNIEILKALEEEYANELKQKDNLQQKLQSEGLHTLPEMLDALQENTKENAKAEAEKGVFENSDGGYSYAEPNVSLTMSTDLE